MFVPTSIQLLHAFEQHEDVICYSQDQQHLHQDELGCTLCHILADTSGVTPEILTYEIPIEIKSYALQVEYLSYSQNLYLHYSLRAPPSFN